MEIFEDKEYCFSEMLKARSIFGSKLTTKEQWDAMDKTLGLMYLYCDNDIIDMVEATLYESSLRRDMLNLSGQQLEEK